MHHEKEREAIYCVELNRRLKVYDLDSLAVRIREEAPKTRATTVLFFLRGMDTRQKAWAISTYNPGLEAFQIRINEDATEVNPPDADLRKDAAGA
jgi:hypothetical protein